MLSATTLCAQSQSHEANDHQSKLASVEGSWIFTIDGIVQPVRFNSLIAFTAGGVVVTSASIGPPTPYYGIWKQKDSHRVNAVFYSFALDPTGKPGMGKLNLLLQLTSRNELAGTGVDLPAICRVKIALLN